MNEDKIVAMLSNLDDDLVEKEIENLLDGVECDMESIKRKAHEKLEKHNKKNRRNKKLLPYVAAVCACFICINTVYADEISTALKSFFNKTPVYSTMVDGQAYYLQSSLKLDDKLTIDSFMVSEGRMEMECTSKLDGKILEGTKIIPKNASDTKYAMSGISEDGNDKYTLLFMNAKEENYNIKPFKAFDLVVGGETYSVTLDEAKSLDGTQKLAVSEATSNKIDLVNVGANSIEKNGKKSVQLIASFRDKDMKLSSFGQPTLKTVNDTFEDQGENGIVGSGTGSRPEAIYATDKNGTRYQLKVPADAKAVPVTTFDTDAAGDSQLTVKVPALLASYQKSVGDIKIDLPADGEKILNQDVNLFAQKAVLQSVQRLSPTSAKLVFRLNTGADKNVSIRSFHANSQDIKKMTAEFKGDTAVMSLELKKSVNTMNLEISWPEFVMNGNWTINLK